VRLGSARVLVEPTDGRLGGADKITEPDDWLPGDDTVEAQVLAELQPGRQLAERGRFPNGGDEPHAVLDTGGGAVAEGLGRRDGVLGQGRQEITPPLNENYKQPFHQVLTMGEITYQGESPFRVPTAQAPTARVSGRGVEMTVYVSVPGKPPDAVQIQFPMTPDEAARLSADLAAPVIVAEKRNR